MPAGSSAPPANTGSETTNNSTDNPTACHTLRIIPAPFEYLVKLKLYAAQR
jgi:hypothetical protein